MNSVILASQNLTRTITSGNGPRNIVDNFSFEFCRAESYLIIGPSGAGKSSLLRLFNRLDEPTSGSMKFRDIDQCDYSPCDLRQSIGFLFQTPFLFEGTVADNIRYAVSDLSDDEVTRLGDLTQLKRSMLSADSSRLSVGEKQRVALARMLATKPDLILLDEPTSALDPTHTQAVENLIGDIRREFSVTVIVVSHDPQQALRIGGTALLIVDGKLVESGDVVQIANDPQTELGQLYRDRKLT